MNTLPFTKMHGLGNDFVILNHLNQQISLSPTMIATWANRHLGIGFDQLLVIEPGTQGDFFCRIFNSDGHEAEQCGNGLRCVAQYLHDEGISQHPVFTIETRAGVFDVAIQDNHTVRVDMGIPHILERSVDMPIAGQTHTITIVSMGNPHAIERITALEQHDLETRAAIISTSPHFPQGANVGFLQIIDTTHAKLRTFERGAGETLACGSNACAAAVTGILHGWLKPQADLTYRHGVLRLAWEGEGKPVIMTGPTARVFSGTIRYCETA